MPARQARQGGTGVRRVGTSPRTSRPSPTTGSATAPARSSPPRSWNPRSTRSSANAWSRNNRCAGAPEAHTYYCRSAPGYSTTPSPTTTDAGTPTSPTPPTGKTRPRSLPRFVPLSNTQGQPPPGPGPNGPATITAFKIIRLPVLPLSWPVLTQVSAMSRDINLSAMSRIRTESANLLLIHICDVSGDRIRAIQHARLYAESLKDELGLPPPALAGLLHCRSQ